MHTDEYYAQIVAELAERAAAETIILGDEAGVLSPERARTWIRADASAHAGDVPLELHFHNTTGMGDLNHIIGVEEGIDILHTAVSSLANGVSMPSTEVSVDNMRRLGHEVSRSTTAASPRSPSTSRGSPTTEGYPPARRPSTRLAALQQQFPGGMMGTLRDQLAQADMEERLPAVLEEAIRVRAEMG